jgi:small subunit ribosomal protein S20
MAHHKQSAKRIRTNEKARLRNQAQHTEMKSAVKRVINAPDAAAAKAVLAIAMKKVDKAAKHHVIHKNAAARIKSRLSRAAARAS